MKENVVPGYEIQPWKMTANENNYKVIIKL